MQLVEQEVFMFQLSLPLAVCVAAAVFAPVDGVVVVAGVHVEPACVK